VVLGAEKARVTEVEIGRDVKLGLFSTDYTDFTDWLRGRVVLGAEKARVTEVETGRDVKLGLFSTDYTDFTDWLRGRVVLGAEKARVKAADLFSKKWVPFYID
jgi:hypothetical protein